MHFSGWGEKNEIKINNIFLSQVSESESAGIYGSKESWPAGERKTELAEEVLFFLLPNCTKKMNPLQGDLTTVGRLRGFLNCH